MPLQDTRIARGDGGSIFVLVKEVTPAPPAFDFGDSSTTAIVSTPEITAVVESAVESSHESVPASSVVGVVISDTLDPAVSEAVVISPDSILAPDVISRDL